MKALYIIVALLCIIAALVAVVAFQSRMIQREAKRLEAMTVGYHALHYKPLHD